MTRAIVLLLLLGASASAQELRNTEIGRALIVLRPGEAWTLAGDDCTKLQWHAKTKPPTCKEIDAEIARAKKTPPPTKTELAAERLRALGLSVDDIKALLK